MSIASSSGFIGGSNSAPEIALFPMGATSRAGAGFLTGATGKILDADSPEVIQIVNPATAINQDLPSTGVKAGRIFTVIVSGASEANYVAVRSSGGNEIDRIGGSGFIRVIAVQDTPTTAAHWTVIDVQEFSEILTISGVTGAVTNNASLQCSRRNNLITVRVAQASASAAVSVIISLPAGSNPTRFRPASGLICGSSVLNNGILNAATCAINSNGSLEFRKYDVSNFSGASAISANWAHMSYMKN